MFGLHDTCSNYRLGALAIFAYQQNNGWLWAVVFQSFSPHISPDLRWGLFCGIFAVDGYSDALKVPFGEFSVGLSPVFGHHFRREVISPDAVRSFSCAADITDYK